MSLNEWLQVLVIRRPSPTLRLATVYSGEVRTSTAAILFS